MRLIALALVLSVVVVPAGSWSTAAPIPERFRSTTAFCSAGRSTSLAESTRPVETTKVAYRYDPRRNTWERIADVPEPRHHMPLVVLNDTLYAVGGFDGLRFTPKANAVDLSSRQERVGGSRAAAGAARRDGGRVSSTARSSSSAATGCSARCSTRPSSTIREPMRGRTGRQFRRSAITSRRRW